jgi:hypothetical protein
MCAVSACQDEPRPTPTQSATKTATKKPKPKAKAPPKTLRGSMNGVGPITAEVKPTVEAIDALLDDRYEVRASKDGPEGSAVQVLHQGKVVLDVFPYEDGGRIFRAVATDSHVVFPWGTKVGDRIGDHKFWDQMKCVLEPAPFVGKARCQAYDVGRIAYLVEGWEGAADALPGKELLADLKIAGSVWTPTYD